MIERVLVLRPAAVSPQTPEQVEGCAGRAIRAVERRGKNIVLRLEGGVSLRVHLRMTGDLYVIADARLRPLSARVSFELAGGRAIVFDDPRALGRVAAHQDCELESLLAGLGPEPLSAAFTPARFVEIARRSRHPVKLFLMDQTKVAGVGNIYAAEALFRARIDPRRPVNRVSRTKLERLHKAVVEVLREAVRAALAGYRRPGRVGETEAFARAVYGREGESCFLCGRRVRRLAQGGRSTYFCPGCQR